jgi:hypothetical protein
MLLFMDNVVVQGGLEPQHVQVERVRRRVLNIVSLVSILRA